MALQCLRLKSLQTAGKTLTNNANLPHATRLGLLNRPTTGLLAYGQRGPVLVVPGRQSTSTVHVEEARETVLDNHGHPPIDLTFTNCKEAYRSKTTRELLRAYAVFQICSIPVVVNNNKTLMKWSRSILGASLFKKLMKATFYGHFVAGEDKVAIRPVVNQNKLFGVKSILDYSAEEDVSNEEAKDSEMKAFDTDDMVKISDELKEKRRKGEDNPT